jgi:NADH-quinone oxidoreductase subunit L
MMAAMGAGAAGAGFHHLLTHGVFKALLFLGAGAVIHAVGTNDIFAMGRLARRMPQTAIVFVVGALSLAGIPLFGGFFSKEQILGAVWVNGHAVPFGMLAIAAFLTAFYMFRVVFIAFFAGPVTAPAAAGAHPAGGHGAHGPGHAHDAPAVMTVPLWILAALSVAIGVSLIPHPESPVAAPHALEWIAVAISAAGIALAWLTYQRRAIDPDRLARPFAAIRDAAAERFWVDEAFIGVYRQVILGGSRIVGWIDRFVVDGVVNVLSAWTLTWGDALRRMQTGFAQDYVFAVGLGVILLIAWSQWVR